MSNNTYVGEYKSLDEFFRKTNLTGSFQTVITDTVRSINHKGVKKPLPANNDTIGYTFFTRPLLNLSTANVRNKTELYGLLNTNTTSVHSMVRNTLDPLLAYDQTSIHEASRVSGVELHTLKNTGQKAISSPLVDKHLAFIPVLTNSIKTISGWPDIVLPTYTSKSGVRKEQWSMADGSIDIYESYDLDATFINFNSEPIMLMVGTWLTYMASVFDGTLSPYVWMIINNELDYNTRIYRLVLDSSKTFVKKIAATGASFPLNVPSGKFFDFSSESNFGTQTNDINIRFKCNGALYNQDSVIDDFNETSAIFNTDIANLLDGKEHNLVKLVGDNLDFADNHAYPIINTSTLELEWWVFKSTNTENDFNNKEKAQ